MTKAAAPDRRALLLAAAASPAFAVAAAAAAEPAGAGAAAGVTVIAEITAKPEHADEVRAALKPFAAATRREAGCLHYALYEDGETPGRFFTFERWATRGALDAHLASPAMKEAGAKLGPAMAAPAAIRRLTTLSS